MNPLLQYVSKYKTLRRLTDLLKQGRCPVCEMKLTSTMHTNCRYVDNSQIKIIDKK